MADNSSLQTSEFLPLYERLLAEEPAAWGVFFTRIQRRLEEAAHAQFARFPQLKGWIDCDHIVQEARIKVVNSIRRDRPTSMRQLHSWVARILRDTLVDEHRRHFGPLGRARNEVRFTDITPTRHGPSADYPLNGRPNGAETPRSLEAWTRFHEAVETLPEPLKTVVDFRYYHGCTHGEVAELLEVDESTVRRHWVAARLRLRDVLGDDGADLF